MPLIQLKLAPDKAIKCVAEEVLKPVAVQVAKTMEWPLERVTVTGEVIQDEYWFHKGGRQPLVMVYWLEGKPREERQKMMQSVASAVARLLEIDTQEVNVMVIELKQGSLLTEGRYL